MTLVELSVLQHRISFYTQKVINTALLMRVSLVPFSTILTDWHGQVSEIMDHESIMAQLRTRQIDQMTMMSE